MDGIEECLVSERGVLRYSKDAKDFIGPGEPVLSEVQVPASDTRDLLRPVQVGFTLTEGFFRPLALSYIPSRGERACHLSAVTAINRGIIEHGIDVSVAVA